MENNTQRSFSQEGQESFRMNREWRGQRWRYDAEKTSLYLQRFVPILYPCIVPTGNRFSISTAVLTIMNVLDLLMQLAPAVGYENEVQQIRSS